MDYQEYLKEKKEIYDILLKFLNCEGDEEYNVQNLFDILQKQNILKSKVEMTNFFRLLVKISNNYHRSPEFLQKIKQILQNFIGFMKNSYTHTELFNIFKSNKPITLFLIKNQIIDINKEIVKEIIFRSQETNTKYHHFFYPEIKKFLETQELENLEQELKETDQNIMENFDLKREKGENESFICELIRNDSIEEFVIHVNQTNLSLLSTIIKPSIFETNSFLCKNNPSLIEYAAFFSSIQIFQYLKFNNVEMKPSLWLYTIHGKNAEIIHLLEENSVQIPDNSYQTCLNESVKCHHNEFAKYFQDNFLNENEIDYKYEFKFFNYELIPSELRSNSTFYYLCSYDYQEMIKLYLKQNETNLNENNNKVLYIDIFDVQFTFYLFRF